MADVFFEASRSFSQHALPPLRRKPLRSQQDLKFFRESGCFLSHSTLNVNIFAYQQPAPWLCLSFNKKKSRSGKAKTQTQAPTRLTGRAGSGFQDFLYHSHRRLRPSQPAERFHPSSPGGRERGSLRKEGCGDESGPGP